MDGTGVAIGAGDAPFPVDSHVLEDGGFAAFAAFVKLDSEHLSWRTARQIDQLRGSRKRVPIKMVEQPIDVVQDQVQPKRDELSKPLLSFLEMAPSLTGGFASLARPPPTASAIPSLASLANQKSVAAPSLASLAKSSKPVGSLSSLASLPRPAPRPLGHLSGGLPSISFANANLARESKPSPVPSIVTLPGSMTTATMQQLKQKPVPIGPKDPHPIESPLSGFFRSRPVMKIPVPESQSMKDANLSVLEPFKFDTPSPDDVVLQAREKAEKARKQQPKLKATPKKEQRPSKYESREASSQLDFDLDALRLSNSKAPPKLTKTASGSGSKVNLSVPSVPVSRTSSNSSIKKDKTKRVDVKEEYLKRSKGKENLNLVVVGHVDAGKSTIMGHVLYLLDQVNERTMRKYEKESEKIRKGSFMYAWVLDETEEERNRGITIDVAISSFQTKNRSFTLLDAPGHRDFVPNMISGASQADVALLVIDAKDFETGFENGGQTKEHALLLRSLGVSQVGVVVNKMDSVAWSEAKYNEICDRMTNFLVQQAGFKPGNLSFIPISGYTGDNLIKRELPQLSWYKGPTLVELIDTFDVPPRPIDGPLRLSVVDFFKGGVGGSASISISGRIESGSMQVGDTVLVMPANETATIKAIEIGDESAKWAVAGDNILVSIMGLDIMHISTGFILCDPEKPVAITSHFKAQIITFELNVPLTLGVPVVFHHQSLTEPGHISKLHAILNRSTGEVTKKYPRALVSNSTASIEVKLDRPVCLELYKDSKILGRFTLRCGPTTVAAGIVTEILSYEKKRVFDDEKEK